MRMEESHFQYRDDRCFQLSPLFTQPGWYLNVPDSPPLGPFPSRDAAKMAAHSPDAKSLENITTPAH
jgi:hypothetical protein